MIQTKWLWSVLAAVCLTLPAAGAAKTKKKISTAELSGPAALWREPIDIASRNLYYGPGGQEHAPHTVFTFEKEDLEGSNPKFVVHDENGVTWKVKLGEEARPETVASRLVWAAGYFADEDYFLPELRVAGMPARLHRGQKWMSPDGSFPNVRLKRSVEGQKKVGTWRWRKDPFVGTREWNGLRVMMALINNWDLKDANNAIYQVKRNSDSGELEFLISDLGASFGTAGLVRHHAISKGNLYSYMHSKFIRKIAPSYVDFNVPSRPAVVVLVNPHEFFSRLGLEWIGRRVPRDDARWMGHLLARLSSDQVRDAFRAAGYSPEEIDAFTSVVEQRIGELTEL